MTERLTGTSDDAWRFNMPPCPYCRAGRAWCCRTPKGKSCKPHKDRIDLWRKETPR